MIGDHGEGFEKESKLHELFFDLQCLFSDFLIKWKLFEQIVALFSPDLIDGSFERRECIRMLRYRGCCDVANNVNPSIGKHASFKIGGIYMSKNFNGATYTIDLDGFDKMIGCNYFEWVKIEKINSKG